MAFFMILVTHSRLLNLYGAKIDYYIIIDDEYTIFSVRINNDLQM